MISKLIRAIHRIAITSSTSFPCLFKTKIWQKTRIATQLSSHNLIICKKLLPKLPTLPLTMDAGKRKTKKSMGQNLHLVNGDSLWGEPVLLCPTMAFLWEPTITRQSPMRSHNDQTWCLTPCIRVPSKTQPIQWHIMNSLSRTRR